MSRASNKSLRLGMQSASIELDVPHYALEMKTN